MLGLADVIADIHPLSVTLTGGEPLLREDLPEIMGYLKDKGVLAGVATNGLLLDENMIVELTAAGAGWFEISLPSALPGECLALTGDDVLQRIKDAMLNVVDLGGRLTASHIMTSSNIGSTGEAVDLAYALGARTLALNRFVPGGAGMDRPDLLPSRPQLQTALELASRHSVRLPGMVVYTGIPVEPCIHHTADYPGVKFGSCLCGRDKWAVGPDGSIRVCEQSDVVLGNLLTRSFEEIRASAEVHRFRGTMRKPECPGCEYLDLCGGGCRFLN
jgi:pyrroloquinoline quinone biosynthesis protein E